MPKNPPNELIRLAAEVGAKTALETMAKEKKKAQESRYNRRLRNTKTLLEHYRDFKDHVAYAVFDVERLVYENAVDVLDLMWDPNGNSELYVESIKKSVARTQLIVNHITEMLRIYEIVCARSPKPEDMRRYRVIEALYIIDKPMTISEIKEKESVDERTIYRDRDTAIEKLSSLIFGIDGLKRE
jgi:hypothetical protein